MVLPGFNLIFPVFCGRESGLFSIIVLRELTTWKIHLQVSRAMLDRFTAIDPPNHSHLVSPSFLPFYSPGSRPSREISSWRVNHLASSDLPFLYNWDESLVSFIQWDQVVNPIKGGGDLYDAQIRMRNVNATQFNRITSVCTILLYMFLYI